MTMVAEGRGAVGDPSERERRAEELLRAIVGGTASATGTAFFSLLVQHLAKALHGKELIARALHNNSPRTIIARHQTVRS
jgi:hypothetical protein